MVGRAAVFNYFRRRRHHPDRYQPWQLHCRGRIQFLVHAQVRFDIAGAVLRIHSLLRVDVF